MCIECYKEFGSPRIINEGTVYASLLIDKIYAYNCVGGNAHIVLDDWNLEDGNILWCLNEGLTKNFHKASKEELELEKECLRLFYSMSEEERASSLAISRGYICAKR